MILIKCKELFQEFLNKTGQEEIEYIEYHTAEAEIKSLKEEEIKDIIEARKNKNVPVRDSIIAQLLMHKVRGASYLTAYFNISAEYGLNRSL